MNDLGMTLGWLAVQVGLLLAPALMLHAVASRRGPARGAWIAALSLALVVILNVAAFLPGFRSDERGPVEAIASPLVTTEDTAATDVVSNPTRQAQDAQSTAGRGFSMAWLRLAWDRIGRGAAEPAARCRPWGSFLATLALVGTGVGLLHLAIGLWAVVVCCRRGRPVDDREMIALLDELRLLMGCRRTVMLRAVPDLTTPATAGWLRPVLLLPDDWRSWSLAERRAVLAHELAHIVRGDYAAGLIARLAVVLNYYHPLVRWMAMRLQLQQEQAADAFGARFAGGPTRYLVSLSSLALRQDGRSRCWPARAFLPARGTLIRRIQMLKDRSRITTFDRPRSSARQWLTALGLVGLTLGVATLRGPALAAEEDQPSATMAAVAAPEPGHRLSPFGPLYLREGADGVAIFRPAAAFRHKGLAPLLPLIREEVDGDLAGVAKSVQVDPSRPGFLKLRAQDIEWVTAGVHFGRDGTGDKTLHRFMLSCTAVRMIEPFNWLAFLHQWKIECKEVHLGGRAYYKLSGKVAQLLGPNDGCVFLPDDRTIVVDGEAVIRKIVSGEMPNQPDFLRSQDWERANRGLVAFAIKSQDDAFAKHYDLGRPDDAVVLSLFRGIDSWILSVDDADAIVLHADAACHNREAGEAVSRSLESLIELGRRAIANEHPKTPDPSGSHSLSVRMIKGLLAGLRVQHTDTAITVQTQDFGTLADFAAVVDGEVKETKARTEARKEAKAKNALKR